MIAGEGIALVLRLRFKYIGKTGERRLSCVGKVRDEDVRVISFSSERF